MRLNRSKEAFLNGLRFHTSFVKSNNRLFLYISFHSVPYTVVFHYNWKKDFTIKHIYHDFVSMKKERDRGFKREKWKHACPICNESVSLFSECKGLCQEKKGDEQSWSVGYNPLLVAAIIECAIEGLKDENS